MSTIEDLLKKLQGTTKKTKLSNLGSVKDIWSRIGKKDFFSELNLTESELIIAIEEFIVENPYNNIS